MTLVTLFQTPQMVQIYGSQMATLFNTRNSNPASWDSMLIHIISVAVGTTLVLYSWIQNWKPQSPQANMRKGKRVYWRKRITGRLVFQQIQNGVVLLIKYWPSLGLQQSYVLQTDTRLYKREMWYVMHVCRFWKGILFQIVRYYNPLDIKILYVTISRFLQSPTCIPNHC